MYFSITIAIFLNVLQCAITYPTFQRSIPNGNRVPHPCDPTKIWKGVGHMVPQGSGARNDFGWHFRNNGFRWTQSLCEQDSDGDGLTNGVELGDPNCTWTPRSNVELPKPRSHPGFCETFNSPKCASLQENHNTNPRCDQQGFQCDAIKEPGVRKITYRIPRFEIAPQNTSYRCIIFDAPSDVPYHVVGSYRSVDNELLHHILLLGCLDDNSFPPVNQMFTCGMMYPSSCTLIGGYIPGGQGQCMTGPYGFLLGPGGFKKIYLQFHYNNPEQLRGRFDNSGMDLYYTSKLRQYNAGVATIRGMYFSIPPGQSSYNVTASCASDCTNKYIESDVHVFFGFNHMHLYGRKIKTEVIRNGEPVAVIAQDDNFDLNVPTIHPHFTAPIKVQKGDEIRTTCTYDTSRSTQAINFGLSTQDEMCVGFAAFYPREMWQEEYLCINYKSVPICQIRATGNYKGCHFRRFLRNIKTSPRVTNLLRICESSQTCTSRCFHYLSRLREHKCLQGDLLDLFKSNTNALEDDRYRRFFHAFTKCRL